MRHSIDFFRDEVRCGFYIPAAIKQAWAAELDVLKQIDRICEKHGIRYFADWGTILGAVRHGGFVPWDDDLDICMLRDDYSRFRAVADAELPKEYTIHDYERQEDHWLFLARVVNHTHICFEEAYLDEHDNFPWLAGVDIFLRDYLYADDDAEKARDEEVMNILALAEGVINGDLKRELVEQNVLALRQRYGADIPLKASGRDTAVGLYKLAEQQMSRVAPEDTDRVGQIFPWVLKHGVGVAEAKERYEQLIRLPFEDTTMPVPAAYHKVLTSRYGNYHVIRKVWGGHGYPFFEGQKQELEQMSGEKLPSFTFSRDMLMRNVPDRSGSLRTIAGECITELESLLRQAKDALERGGTEAFEQAMADSQQLAADLGTLIESVKGEKRSSSIEAVEALQHYCDCLWEEYEQVAKADQDCALSRSHTALLALKNTIQKMILDRKELLFLPIGPREWAALAPVYESIDRADNDVFIVPLPLLRKNYFGEIHMTEEEIQDAVHREDYPAELALTDFLDFDLALHCPDTIYVQNPYDGANPVLSVPGDFYVRNLQYYTDRIVYIPVARTAEFGAEDSNDLYNMKHYVTAPGVICADEVLVQSENIREQYVNALSAFAGEESREVWTEKVKLNELSGAVPCVRGDKKRLLYCIGANELAEHKDVFLEALKEKIEIMREASDDLRISLILYPQNRQSFREVNERLADELFALLDQAGRDAEWEWLSNDIKDAEAIASSHDAYYGSTSPLVPVFVQQKRPVMLADYGLYQKP